MPVLGRGGQLVHFPGFAKGGGSVFFQGERRELVARCVAGEGDLLVDEGAGDVGEGWRLVDEREGDVGYGSELGG